MGNQRGFTLIELVMVIVVLGILAAVALPRFAELSSDARKSNVDALEGAIRAAMSSTYAKSMVEGEETHASKQVTIQGVNLDTVYGYPALVTIDNALSEFEGFDFNGTTGVFSMTNAPTPADCSITYATPAAAGQPPTVTVTKTGC